MYVSRLTFHTLPGKTQEMQEKLTTLREWVAAAGGLRPRVMRAHYGSLGAPDLVFEQEVSDVGALELQIKKVTDNKDFQKWTQEVVKLLEQSSKRELYQITDAV
jgi:hypothetical protein